MSAWAILAAGVSLTMLLGTVLNHRAKMLDIRIKHEFDRRLFRHTKEEQT